jgi:excisionase family DNA binding protein
MSGIKMMRESLLHDDRIAVLPPKSLPPLSVGLRVAAQMIGVSDRHLQKLAAAGQVPSAMVGCRRVFRLGALDQWLKDREMAAV